MINKKDQLLKNITDQLEVVAKGMLTTNTPDFNLKTEREVSRISKDIDVFAGRPGAGRLGRIEGMVGRLQGLAGQPESIRYDRLRAEQCDRPGEPFAWHQHQPDPTGTVSMGPRAAPQGGGILKQMSSTMNANKSTSIGGVNVFNYGQPMSGAKLRDELLFAGG